LSGEYCADPGQLLSAGMAGYITKTASVTELIAAIKTVYSGQKYMDPQIAYNLPIAPALETKNPLDLLSKTELLITHILAKGHKLQSVTGRAGLSINTARIYRARILRKLGVTNNVELARLAIKYGLLGEQETTTGTLH
jgi:DNA-binding NarL/FixJ family response regulator